MLWSEDHCVGEDDGNDDKAHAFDDRDHDCDVEPFAVDFLQQPHCMEPAAVGRQNRF